MQLAAGPPEDRMKRYSLVGAAIFGAWLVLAAPALGASPAAGPPYPDAVSGQRVYDYAGIFTPATISQAEEIIAGIESRTGAQVAVYTQVKPESDTLDKANQDALDLMNQWGVGRKGFDDGLVVMFDMQPSLLHGQVSLYAGSGYRAAFLSDADRQQVFNEDMKPLLVAGDMDGGLMVALHDIDANATPEHAAALEQGRQVNAVIAFGGIGLGLLLALLAVAAWLRHGRDPVSIDDSSVLMAAPPADLTPAMATLLLDDRTSGRTVTAGLVDLAARGCIAFEADLYPSGATKTSIRYLGGGQGVVPPLEAALRDDIASKSEKHDGLMSPKILYRLLDSFDDFKNGLETTAVERGWLNARPSSVMNKWAVIAALEFSAAIAVGIFWLIIQASGLFTLALGFLVAGGVSAALTRYMPARTRQGAMLWAMLSAYRRTLKLTLAQAQSMTDVVSAKALPWVTTPDDAMAWGVAFGLGDEIEAVLSRSLAAAEEPVEEDAEGKLHAVPLTVWHPSWYSTGNFTGSHSGGSGHSAAISGGMFSAAPIPDFSSLVSVIGSINHPDLPESSSAGSGSSSSFSSGGFGGGGGGGGGGAGGGF
jgi:uncharacterized membrane protein YgcG